MASPHLRRLTRNLAFNVSPTWSPSAPRIAFANTSGDAGIYVTNAEGTGVGLAMLSAWEPS